MSKLKFIFCWTFVVSILSGCSKSPEKIVENIYSFADKGDYDKILRYVVPDSISDITEADKEKFSNYMSEQLGTTPLYSSYKLDSIVSENNGKEINFIMKTTLNDGLSHDEHGILRKTDKGGWKLVLQKSDTDLSNAFSIEDKKVNSKELLRVIRYAYDMTLSDKGIPQHQLRAAFYFYDGIMIPKNLERYFTLVSEAAKNNYVRAIFELGDAYYYGDGTNKDDKKAFENWQKAADLKYGKAYYSIGEAYASGIGVPQDYEKAKEWLEKSIETNDDGDSYHLLAYMYNKGVFGKSDADKEMEYLQKATERGNEQSKTLLGANYVIGDRGVKNVDKGLELISEAAENGYIEASLMLGMLYSSGEFGVSKDMAKAFYFYKKGADTPLRRKSGDTTEKESKKKCILMVAECFKKGLGTTVNNELYIKYKNMKI